MASEGEDAPEDEEGEDAPEDEEGEDAPEDEDEGVPRCQMARSSKVVDTNFKLPGKWYNPDKALREANQRKRAYEMGRRDEQEDCTHIDMTGAVYDFMKNGMVQGDKAINLLYDKIGDALSNWDRNHTTTPDIPCLLERRTAIFPLYVDLDIAVPVNELSPSDVAHLIGLVSHEVMRFYKTGENTARRAQLSRCVVLMKKRNGRDASWNRIASEQEAPQYKHGIHLHFPELLVTVAMALQIRWAVVAGLKVKRFADTLGVEYPDWERFVDESVYVTATLRMIGASKSSMCKKCPTPGEWDGGCLHCYGTGKVIDGRVYELFMAMENGVHCKTFEKGLINAPKKLVRACTLRSIHKNVTPGYAVYPGCDLLVSGQCRAPKRKLTPAERKQNSFDEFKDDEVEAIMRSHLTQHFEGYGSCRIQMKRLGAMRMLAQLSGFERKYCVNKGDYHNGNGSYMMVERMHIKDSSKLKQKDPSKIVTKSSDDVVARSKAHARSDPRPYVSQMRCYSQRLGTQGMPCCKVINNMVLLTNEEVDICFPHLVAEDVTRYDEVTAADTKAFLDGACELECLITLPA
jgi:hypothetical protein